jgi:head-tail adaptor
MTTAGDLKWRVRFDKPGSVNDPAGGELNDTWEEQFTRAAEIRPLKGSEPVMAQRLNGMQPSLIVVRFDSLTRTIDPSWRVVELLNGADVRYYSITSPPEDMERERKYITIMAVQGAPDGGDRA